MAKRIGNEQASRPDEDNPEWTAAHFKRAKPALDMLPGLIGEQAAQELLRHAGGRPRKAVVKVNQTLRLDPDVLEAYRSKGAGWQSVINDVLREHMSEERKGR